MPKPNVEVQNGGGAKTNGQESKNENTRKINYPSIGVVDVQNIPKTPLADQLVLKEQQNPRTAYKIAFDTLRQKGFKFQSVASIIIGLCAVLSLFSLKSSRNKPNPIPNK